MNYPAIMEERGSKHNLVHERFERLSDYGWLEALEHDLERRPDNIQHQYVVFSVYPLYPTE